uniref:F-box domain-containing protein n=1 Tax=Triticum urartu TaxID=4572 RepID=A0A8R7NYY1_TRIUA
MGSPPRRRSCSSMACGGTRMEWSELPADLVLAVFALLPSDADRVRFRAVCQRWAAVAAFWRPRPWLVGSRTDRSGQGAAMSSFWLSQAGRLVPFAAAVPPGLEYLSSSHGYLVLSDPTAVPKAITLVNPVTGRRIPLPPIAFFKRWHDVATVVLSADPGGATEWAAVAAGFPADRIAYYSSATGAWTPLAFSAAGYAGVEHYRGRFYVAFKNQLCVICELECGAPPAVIPLDSHLVECDGQLLLVSVRDETDYNSDNDIGAGDADADDEGSSAGGGSTRVVEVHRVELVGDGAVRLVRVEDLGWH